MATALVQRNKPLNLLNLKGWCRCVVVFHDAKYSGVSREVQMHLQGNNYFYRNAGALHVEGNNVRVDSVDAEHGIEMGFLPSEVV